MSTRIWSCIAYSLIALMALYKPAQGVTTSYGGETIEWELKADGVPIEVFNERCEGDLDPNSTNLSFTGTCYYSAHWPPVGSELHVVAVSIPVEVTPEQPTLFHDTYLGACFTSYYEDCPSSSNCPILVAEDWALFNPKEFSKDYVDIAFWRQWIYYPSGGDRRRISIHLTLLNAELGSIQSMPWLKGPPKDNRQTRYRPSGGKGPGQ
jgi:hypothetical protein